MNTFPVGISLTAHLRSLQLNGNLVPDIVSPDTLVCTVYSSTDVEQPVAGDITGDGTGNYIFTFVAPSAAGSYYLIWNSYIDGQYGRHRYDFQLRSDV